jgi:2-polyprenyl-3-methyl-5-hydroxy-6-metoxy-1,4-benzoquinol methylase
MCGAVPPPNRHDVAAGGDLLAEQAGYYRRRAAEYDVTACGDLDAARARITWIVAALRPAGNALEIACGTGLWTGALAEAASTVTAIDAAPQMVDIARGRITAANVRFEVADVFSWTAPARFDTVFFAFWLSHVPASRFRQFWRQLRGLVAEQGRVLLVDEHPDVRDKEEYAAASDEIIHRRLADGSEHHLVKIFIHPGQLSARLRASEPRSWGQPTDRRSDCCMRWASGVRAGRRWCHRSLSSFASLRWIFAAMATVIGQENCSSSSCARTWWARWTSLAWPRSSWPGTP